ncbi:MAG: hypothetical protein V9G14_00570 [Cypionkella sp.]
MPLFRYTNIACEVDTLAFGAYRREVIEKVGYFNERKLIPATKSDCLVTITVRVTCGLYDLVGSTHSGQLLYPWLTEINSGNSITNTGSGKSGYCANTPRAYNSRHLILGFVCTEPVGFARFESVHTLGRLIDWAALSACISSQISALLCDRPVRLLRFFPALLVIFPTLHLAYGCGFLWALPQFLPQMKKSQSTKSDQITIQKGSQQ